MMATWGADSSAYAGRSMTLFNDPAVKWGGIAVGGIRISHLSHIERDMTIALTATRGKKSPYTVKMLQGQNDETAARKALATAITLDELSLAWRNKAMAPFRDALAGYLEQRKAELTPPEQGRTDEQNGDAFDGDEADPEPVWQSMVTDWHERIGQAESASTIIAVRSELSQHRDALPDDVVTDLDKALFDGATKFTIGE